MMNSIQLMETARIASYGIWHFVWFNLLPRYGLVNVLLCVIAVIFAGKLVYMLFEICGDYALRKSRESPDCEEHKPRQPSCDYIVFNSSDYLPGNGFYIRKK